MEAGKYIVAIELGTSKIVGIVGVKNEDGRLNILATEKEDSAGCIKRGCIFNVEDTASKIQKIIKKLENRLSLKITKVFVDWLKEAGQTYWQILPLGVTSYGDSPYQSFSAFAGNPYFISLDELVKEGVLTAEECKKAKFGRKADDIDYSQLYKERGRLLRLAYSRSDIGHNAEFAAFCEQNKWWLDDFALFMAVKDRFEGKPWIEWAEDIRLRWQNAMDYYRRELYFEVEYYKYLQFKFDQQWRALKAYANEKGIRIIGDIPIYVALDSADAWANPQMFQLDEDNIPTAVAGVPPDGFSPTGQLWGNPLYRWEKHRETGYQWWITRLWYCFELYDVVRIDHFRGFDEYFSIPYGSETVFSCVLVLPDSNMSVEEAKNGLSPLSAMGQA